MNGDPFPGATSKIKVPRLSKKQKKRMLKRGGIVCTCGALEQFFSNLHYLHDDNCIINTKGKK